MNEELVSIVMGVAVLVIAAVFAVGHYRREHRRSKLLRELDQMPGWYWQRHQPRN
ncbi:hypothetical protein LMG28727_01003 [Paraburkholderia kirstenboschensis]|uniref:hypothetical protein n=1 Tax=Paraburkholderia kirstenboschensis TaxID=1245436 RepID=UPI000A974AAF|nr:hypothetical protein [Paraburkholderia kirstenboschensis]CAD6514755.1 hypothetical protein LMG28727_01003 [Paraburkholderia kirstenboschensis]